VQDKLLIELRDRGPTLDNLLATESAKQLLQMDDEVVWRDMLVQSQHPFVQLAGFACIRKKRPGDADRAALMVMQSASNPAFVIYGEVIQQIAEAGDTPEFNRWFEECDAAAMNQAKLALVVGELLAEYESREAEPPKKLVEVLNTMVTLPGLPRVTYLVHADVENVDDADLIRLCVSALNAPIMNDLRAALIIRRHLSFMEKYKAVIERSLEEASRPRFTRLVAEIAR